MNYDALKLNCIAINTMLNDKINSFTHEDVLIGMGKNNNHILLDLPIIYWYIKF